MGVDTKMGIIYCWRNVHNEKRYIGQTIHPKDRFNHHKRHLGNYDGPNHFYRAMNKYSSMSDWEYTVIEEVPKELLDEREMRWIAFYDSFKNGYNMSKGGLRHDGYELSEETRRKIGESGKGKKRSNETCRKISEANKGRKHTPKACKNMSTAHNPNRIAIYQNDTLITICDTLKEAAHIADVPRYVVSFIMAGRYHQTKSGYSFKYVNKTQPA